MGGGTEAGEGGEVAVDPLKKSRFLWGVVLAWVPWIPILIGIGRAFKGVSEQKATGLGAVAGGISEMLVLLGLAMMIVGQVAAIMWLSRSFSREHVMRNVISAISIGLSAVMLMVMAGYAWAAWFLARR